MSNCPPTGQFSVCELRGDSSGQYTFVRGLAKDVSKKATKSSRVEVGAKKEIGNPVNDTNASVIQKFSVKLRKLQAIGTPYSEVNRFLKLRLTADISAGMFDLADLLTYGRGDPPKDYGDIYSALLTIPGGIDLSTFAPIVDDLVAP